MNNTIKNGWFFNDGDLNFEQVSRVIEKSIDMYNRARPHKALGMKTPMEILTGRSMNPLMDYRQS